MGGLATIPAGATIPTTTVHGVSVSIPDIESLVGFEEKDEATLRRIPRGYPRFRAHPYVALLTGVLAERSGHPLLLTRSPRVAANAAAYAGLGAGAVLDVEGVPGVALPADSGAEQRLRDFVQHTGGHFSSREAEDLLLARGLLAERQPESADTDDPERHIARVLAAAYGASGEADVTVHNSGMNAVYAAIAAVSEVQRDRGRRRWLQLGWIFFDTVKLLEKRVLDVDHETLASAFDVDAVARAVDAFPGELAGIVAEVPSNPLLQTPDVPALREIADRAGCALVLDATIATPFNVEVLGYADVVCESLTKYATGSADVLLGAAVVNPTSAYAEVLRPAIRAHGERPYVRDAARVAYRIDGYGDRIRHVNKSATALAEYFSGQPAVRHVHWAYEERSAANYRQVERAPESPGGLLMLDLAVPVERVYDSLAVAKGPSFGAEFTMASAQIFTAHYELLETEQGRQELARHGLHRDMLRVSVGVEDVDEIVATFDDAFARARP